MVRVPCLVGIGHCVGLPGYRGGRNSWEIGRGKSGADGRGRGGERAEELRGNGGNVRLEGLDQVGGEGHALCAGSM